MSETWRTGTKVGRTIYRNDQLVGMMDTPELSSRFVAAINGLRDLPLCPFHHMRARPCSPDCIWFQLRDEQEELPSTLDLKRLSPKEDARIRDNWKRFEVESWRYPNSLGYPDIGLLLAEIDALRIELTEARARIAELEKERDSWKHATHAEHGLSLEFKAERDSLNAKLENEAIECGEAKGQLRRAREEFTAQAEALRVAKDSLINIAEDGNGDDREEAREALAQIAALEKTK